MARIQQSIDIGAPVHVVYNQLTQFEDYPRFMQDVETVHQLDDTHLHWSAKMSYQPLEWDSEIVEQIPDQCIAWRNAGGPMQSGKLEVQAVGQDIVRVTMTVECDPAQVPAEQHGSAEEMVTLRLEDDLARFKAFLEERGAETGEWRGEAHGAEVARRVGQMPLDFNAPLPGETAPGEAMASATNQEDKNDMDKAGLKQSIERAVPPSE